MLNSVCKGKYSERLQKFPRITSLLKSYNSDVKKKAAVFEEGDLETFVAAQSGKFCSGVEIDTAGVSLIEPMRALPATWIELSLVQFNLRL